jgi:hypothetical protein
MEAFVLLSSISAFSFWSFGGRHRGAAVFSVI